MYSDWYISFSTVPSSTASTWFSSDEKREGCRAATVGVTPQLVFTVNKVCPDCNDDVLTFKDGSPLATTTALTYTIGSEATVLFQLDSDIESQAGIVFKYLFDSECGPRMLSNLNPPAASIVSTEYLQYETSWAVSIETSDYAAVGSYQLTIMFEWGSATAA